MKINYKEDILFIYDLEIKKAILGRKDEPIEGIEYCKGWDDHAGMGISCIGGYDYQTQRYRVFCEDNMADFTELLSRKTVLIGFNNIRFDNQLLLASDVLHADNFDLQAKSYDILQEVWKSLGLNPDKFWWKTHGGYGLTDMANANIGFAKTGHGGAMAPMQYQRGEWGGLIDYCLNDIFLTKGLMDLILHKGSLKCPKTGKSLAIRSPDEGGPNGEKR